MNCTILGTEAKWFWMKYDHAPNPELLCKGYNLLTFKWDRRDNVSYIVEYRNEAENNWTYFDTVTCNRVTLNLLSPQSSYQVRIWQVGNDGNVTSPTESIIETTTSKIYVPLQVPNLFVKSLELKGQAYEVTLGWEPAEDKACYYDFVMFGGTDDYKQREIKDPGDLFETKIGGLDFDTNYTVSVMAKSSDWYRESNKTTKNFLTPSCIQALKDLNVCTPPMPENLQAEEVLSDDNDDENLDTPLYNVKVSWSEPPLIPDYYTVLLMVFAPNISRNYVNISGILTSVTFQKVELGVHYQIVVTAHSSAGPSRAASLNRHVTGARTTINTSTGLSTMNLTMITVGVFTVLFVIIAGAILVCHQCAKRERTEKRCQYFQELEEKVPQYLDNIIVENLQVENLDKWEIHPDCLSLGTTLGQGAFGVVRKGWLSKGNGSHQEVAVKMLQECPSVEERRQFLQEIEIMKSVGPHKHLVSMVGCCIKTKTLAPLLVVEYCARGDLKTYLQTAWEILTNQNFEIQYAELMDIDAAEPTIEHFSNKTYYLQGENMLQPQDLLSFARQIAIGMEYLSSLHVLHRDLAARNVLVCEDKTIKVSDFGLSRDVYRDNVYYKSGSGKLPVRWMALESITHQVYTTQSDVWSYGILLWEIVTLGGNPYPGISTQDLPKLLEAGHRMECPANCSKELFMLMTNCWKKVPKERPTFTEIRNYLDKLLENVGDYLHLGVTVCKEMNSARGTKTTKNKRTTSSERYVKPIIVHR